jgi:hypothetical protein
MNFLWKFIPSRKIFAYVVLYGLGQPWRIFTLDIYAHTLMLLITKPKWEWKHAQIKEIFILACNYVVEEVQEQSKNVEL